jgi:hypothetical protein
MDRSDLPTQGMLSGENLRYRHEINEAERLAKAIIDRLGLPEDKANPLKAQIRPMVLARLELMRIVEDLEQASGTKRAELEGKHAEVGESVDQLYNNLQKSMEAATGVKTSKQLEAEFNDEGSLTAAKTASLEAEKSVVLAMDEITGVIGVNLIQGLIR